MKPVALRFAAAAALGCMALAARAETYTPVIYGVPPGYAWFQVSGAGNNGMMTGYSVFTNNQSWPSKAQALYLTPQGFRNITPAGWSGAMIFDSWSGTFHVGGGTINGSYPYHALFWIGAGTVYDIHPAGSIYNTSEALGGGGYIQVGYVNGNYVCAECNFAVQKHACMWSQTASSFSRLHSTNHEFSRAAGTDGIQQVGEGRNRGSLQYNALLWRGANSFAVNLHPAGLLKSTAYGVDAGKQVGTVSGVSTGNKLHAALWSNTAASFVDLNPNNAFSETEALAVRNGVQVGIGKPISTPNRTQAILWHGKASTWTNLHSGLGAPWVYWNSHAEDIDNQGNVTGFIEKDGARRPVIWIRN